MSFILLDEQEYCKGIYRNGILSFEPMPEELDRTWKYVPILKDKNIEYANLYCNGKDLTEVCPSDLKEQWISYNKHLDAFLNSFKVAKIDLTEHCIYDLIPNQFLLEYCQLKLKIIDNVFETYQRPVNYDFSLDLEKLLIDIANIKLNLDVECLNNRRSEEKVRTFLRNIQNWSPYIDFNQFGTKTGRLTTKKGTFPILNLNSDFRSVIKPNNDFFLELDFNAAELRALMFLAGQPQPSDDLHSHNATRLKITRDQAKQESFAWLYGSSKVDGSKYDSLFNTKKVLEKYYKDNKVTNYFGREIESDDFHALNYIVQSSTSDMVLRQAIKISKFLKDKKTRIGFIVHDSLVLDVAHSESGLCNEFVNLFSNSEFGVLPVRIRIGKNYGSLKEIKK